MYAATPHAERYWSDAIFHSQRSAAIRATHSSIQSYMWPHHQRSDINLMHSLNSQRWTAFRATQSSNQQYMRPRRKQTDTNLVLSFIRSAQLQSELHKALINSIYMRPRRRQTDINLMPSFIRSAELQSELHKALINSICGHATCKQILIWCNLSFAALSCIQSYTQL